MDFMNRTLVKQALTIWFSFLTVLVLGNLNFLGPQISVHWDHQKFHNNSQMIHVIHKDFVSRSDELYKQISNLETWGVNINPKTQQDFDQNMSIHYGTDMVSTYAFFHNFYLRGTLYFNYLTNLPMRWVDKPSLKALVYQFVCMAFFSGAVTLLFITALNNPSSSCPPLKFLLLPLLVIISSPAILSVARQGITENALTTFSGIGIFLVVFVNPRIESRWLRITSSIFGAFFCYAAFMARPESIVFVFLFIGFSRWVRSGGEGFRRAFLKWDLFVFCLALLILLVAENFIYGFTLTPNKIYTALLFPATLLVAKHDWAMTQHSFLVVFFPALPIYLFFIFRTNYRNKINSSLLFGLGALHAPLVLIYSIFFVVESKNLVPYLIFSISLMLQLKLKESA